MKTVFFYNIDVIERKEILVMYTQNDILLECHHMHKEYGPTIALKDVDFTLHRGEIR